MTSKCKLVMWFALLQLVCGGIPRNYDSYEDNSYEGNPHEDNSYEDNAFEDSEEYTQIDNKKDDSNKCQTVDCMENKVNPSGEHSCSGNGNCISQVNDYNTHKECNGENNCPKSVTPTPSTSTTRACEHPSRLCDSNTLCVDVGMLCDGVYDCEDMSDEDQECEERRCLSNTTCSHNCHDAPEGFVCYCPANYYLEADGVHCSEIHWCEEWGPCSQKCVLRDSTYRCECYPGYVLMEDGVTCEASLNATALIMYSSEDQIIFLNWKDANVFTSSIRQATSLDFYHTNETDMVFWTDRTLGQIFCATLANDALINAEVIVEIATVQSLAVDWIGENLYWIEENMKEIQVSRLNGSFRKTLVAHQTETPTALALDPRDAYIFWIETHRSQRVIKRCSMAGFNKISIVTFDESIYSPTDLTIDYHQRLIYWTNAYFNEIRAISYNGRGFYRISLKEIHIPITHVPVSLFENVIYWIDLENDRILGIDKEFGIAEFEYPCNSNCVDLQIVHPYRQPRDGPSPCAQDNGGCSHLCLLNVNKEYSCGCPHAMRLLSNNKTCIGIDIPRQHFDLTKGPLIIETLNAVDARTVKLVLEVPEISLFDPLDWTVEILYTNRSIINPAFWSLQVFSAASHLISSFQMELFLTELQADTNYRVIVSLHSWKGAPVQYTSEVHTVQTRREESTREIVSPKLYASTTNSTWIEFQWRSFTDAELALMDGLKLSYRKTDDGTTRETPPIHRLVNEYTLYGLTPGATYEVRLVFMKINADAPVLLNAEAVTCTTDTETNRNHFSIFLKLDRMESNSAVLYWYAYPEMRRENVHIYRLAYQNDTGTYSSFGVVDEDTSSYLLIAHLNYNTGYVAWLEMYQKSGEMIKSGTVEFTTMPANTEVPDDLSSTTEYLPTDDILVKHENWRRILLIISGVTAAIILGAVLLIVLLKRRNRSKAVTERLIEEEQSCTISN